MSLIDIGAKTEGVVVDKEYEVAKEMLGEPHVGDEVGSLCWFAGK